MIEVNGILYEPKPQADTPKKRYPKSVMLLMGMAAMYSPYSVNGGEKSRSTNQHLIIDIVKEFELIQLKQSKLSKRQRDSVEFKFNMMYQKVSE